MDQAMASADPGTAIRQSRPQRHRFPLHSAAAIVNRGTTTINSIECLLFIVHPFVPDRLSREPAISPPAKYSSLDFTVVEIGSDSLQRRVNIHRSPRGDFVGDVTLPVSMEIALLFEFQMNAGVLRVSVVPVDHVKQRVEKTNGPGELPGPQKLMLSWGYSP